MARYLKSQDHATNYKQCLALDVPGYVAFYKSQPDFSGNDVFVLEVKFPNDDAGSTDHRDDFVCRTELHLSARASAGSAWGGA